MLCSMSFCTRITTYLVYGLSILQGVLRGEYPRLPVLRHDISHKDSVTLRLNESTIPNEVSGMIKTVDSRVTDVGDL